MQLEDFVAFMQSHDYVYMPGLYARRRLLARGPGRRQAQADSAIRQEQQADFDNKGVHKTVLASAWLAKHAPVEQMTWAPGLPQLVRDKLIGDGGWIDRKGVTVLNSSTR